MPVASSRVSPYAMTTAILDQGPAAHGFLQYKQSCIPLVHLQKARPSSAGVAATYDILGTDWLD